MQLYPCSNLPKYMLDFAQFCCDEIGLSSLRGNIFLNLKRGSIEADSYGITWGDDREVTVLIASHQFGAPISREDKLKTLAHELVHAHQFLTRKMRDIDFVRTVVWEGERVSSEVNSVDPWEVDAVAAESVLFDAWNDRV